jgi:hypothetical protein
MRAVSFFSVLALCVLALAAPARAEGFGLAVSFGGPSPRYERPHHFYAYDHRPYGHRPYDHRPYGHRPPPYFRPAPVAYAPPPVVVYQNPPCRAVQTTYVRHGWRDVVASQLCLTPGGAWVEIR